MNERIKALRMHLGLTQARFAQKIHRSPGLISNIETNVCDVSDDTIRRVCEAFSANETWLRTGEGIMIEAAPADKEGLGERLKQIRKDAGLTQVQFAEKVGYTQAHVHMVEAGKTVPSDDYLQKVMVLFSISEQWLLCGIGEKKAELFQVDDELINWLNNHPEIIRELRERGGLN